MTLEEQSIVAEILTELKRAEKKHPNWPVSMVKAAAIVCEESGELVRAALQFEDEDGPLKDLRKEAIETAATCIRFIKALSVE